MYLKIIIIKDTTKTTCWGRRWGGLSTVTLSRLNEEEVDALLGYQLHIWMLVTLAKMLGWSKGNS